jgi:hypothetical protein
VDVTVVEDSADGSSLAVVIVARRSDPDHIAWSQFVNDGRAFEFPDASP